MELDIEFVRLPFIFFWFDLYMRRLNLLFVFVLLVSPFPLLFVCFSLFASEIIFGTTETQH